MLHELGEFLGLRLNSKKMAVVVRNVGADPRLDEFHAGGMDVHNGVCYLGMNLGFMLSSSGRKGMDRG